MSDEIEPSSLPPEPSSAEFPRPPTPSRPSDSPSDEDRQAVVATIQQALAEDQLTFDEVEQRFARVYAAATQAELRAEAADLPELRRIPPRPEGRHLAPATSVSLIGSTKISGWLAVDGDITAFNLIGDVLVDLSTAELPPGGLTINVIGIVGEIKVIVPDGVRVQSQLVALIGDSKTKLSPPLPGLPTIRVKGFQLIGDTAVYSLSEVPVGPLRRLWAKLRGASD